ncbi:MAG: TIR domain-containing protein, partial [Cyanobacteria bacterium P01_F01_bin.13]
MTKPTAVGDFVWAMADIFISYSRRNKEFVQVLHKALVHSRYDTWVDWEDIAPTTAWWQEIQTGIETAHTFIFVISDASVASKYCRAEVEHAVEYHKRIIPVVRNKDFPREQLPPELAPLQWLLFRPEDDFGTAFDTLVNAINTDLGHQKAHTRLQLRAQEWRQKKQDAGLLLRGSDLDDAEQWLIPAASIEPKPTQVQMEYLAASVKRRRRDNTVQRSAIGGLATLLVATTGAGLGIYGLLRRSTTEALNSGILADSLKAENLMQSNLRFPALIEALGAARRLQNQETRVRPEVRMRAIATLRQALYTVQQKNQWEIHDGFNTASFSADGEMLVSPGQDSTVQLWQRDGTPLQTLKPDLSAINTSRPKIGRVSFSPNGQLIAAEVQPQVQLWRPDGSHVATLSDTHTPFIVDNPIFSPDGNILATPIITDKKERPIALWRSDGTLINRMEGHSDTIWSLAFSPDSNLLASGSQDGTIRLWGRDGTALATLTGHQGEVWHVSFSPDGQLLASGGADGTVRLWGRDGTALATLTGHQGKVWVVNFSPDGQQLASGGLDGTLRLWG